MKQNFLEDQVFAAHPQLKFHAKPGRFRNLQGCFCCTQHFKTSGMPAQLNPIAAENTKGRNEPRL